MPRAPAGEPAYQSLARDIDRVRGQEDGVAAVGKIAGELKGLREELRQQMTPACSANSTRCARTSSAPMPRRLPRKAATSSALEFERLSGAIQTLSEKSDDRSINMLRLELEQVRGALDTLAREETVRSVDRRWDDFDRRFSKFEDRVDAQAAQRTPDPAIAALTVAARTDQRRRQQPARIAVAAFAGGEGAHACRRGRSFRRQQDGRGSDTFDLIEERLDEISRAIVASTATAQTPHFDPEPFERIEARISSLARQIEEVVEDRPAGEVIDRLNMLSQRVDEIAARGKLPEKAIERLAKQIAVIADKIDRAPAMPDADHIFSGIEQRFDVLSGMIDRRQGDAIEHGQAVSRPRAAARGSERTAGPAQAAHAVDSAGIMDAIDARFEELADRLHQRGSAQAVDNAGIMNTIDARFEELADRLHQRGSEQSIDNASIMNAIGTRLEELAGRLDERESARAVDSSSIMNAIDARIEELAGRLDDRGSAQSVDSAKIMHAIDQRFAELAQQLETRPQASAPSADIANLEAGWKTFPGGSSVPACKPRASIPI